MSRVQETRRPRRRPSPIRFRDRGLVARCAFLTKRRPGLRTRAHQHLDPLARAPGMSPAWILSLRARQGPRDRSDRATAPRDIDLWRLVPLSARGSRAARDSGLVASKVARCEFLLRIANHLRARARARSVHNSASRGAASRPPTARLGVRRCAARSPRAGLGRRRRAHGVPGRSPGKRVETEAASPGSSSAISAARALSLRPPYFRHAEPV